MAHLGTARVLSWESPLPGARAGLSLGFYKESQHPAPTNLEAMYGGKDQTATEELGDAIQGNAETGEYDELNLDPGGSSFDRILKSLMEHENFSVDKIIAFINKRFEAIGDTGLSAKVLDEAVAMIFEVDPWAIATDLNHEAAYSSAQRQAEELQLAMMERLRAYELRQAEIRLQEELEAERRRLLWERQNHLRL